MFFYQLILIFFTKWFFFHYMKVDGSSKEKISGTKLCLIEAWKKLSQYHFGFVDFKRGEIFKQRTDFYGQLFVWKA